jgi:hypothetical protein
LIGTLLLHLLRLLPFLCGGHRRLALENLALRQQLAVYKRTANRPKLQRSDRLVWVWLSRVWPTPPAAAILKKLRFRRLRSSSPPRSRPRPPRRLDPKTREMLVLVGNGLPKTVHLGTWGADGSTQDVRFVTRVRPKAVGRLWKKS